MKLYSGFSSVCLAGMVALSITACDLREPAAVPPASVDPDRPGPAAVLGNGADHAAEAAVEASALLAGLAAVQPLVTEKRDAYQPIEPLADHRLLLHPGEGKRARLLLDVGSLAGITLSPVIESIQGNPTCMADASAGIAGLHWQLDDGAVNDVVVDRNYASTIKISTAGATRLAIESSDQNGVIWCDWLAVGFTDVATK